MQPRVDLVGERHGRNRDKQDATRTGRIPQNTHWGIVEGDESYHAKSLVEGDEHWYPVEFISARACWVEIRWHENLEQGGHWEAF